MKRSELLEYRIKRLERLMYEDEIDDFIADTERSVDDEIDDEFSGHPMRITYDTIDEYLDHEIMQRKLEPHGPYAEGIVEWLEGFISNISHKVGSLGLLRRIQKDIKELHNVNVLVAQQKLVNAIRKRIKVEKQEEDALRNKHLDHWYGFIRKLKADLKDEIKRCTGITYNVSYSSNQKVKYFEDLLSAEFTISDIVYKKSRTISFTIWEFVHIRWDIEHLYDVGTKTHWLELYKVDEDDVAKQIAKPLCWRLNGYDFDQGKYYPGVR